jgi:hypothetical protein
MAETTMTPAAEAALGVAQEFIRAVEAKDRAAVDAVLAPQVRQLFMHTNTTTTPRVSLTSSPAEAEAADSA